MDSWFVEFRRKLYELDARAERRWAALEQRGASAVEPRVGVLEQSGAVGGLSSEIPSPDTDSDALPPAKEQQDAAVIPDNWGGWFEPTAHTSEEHDLSADGVFAELASTGQIHIGSGLTICVGPSSGPAPDAVKPAPAASAAAFAAVMANAPKETSPAELQSQIQEPEKPSPRVFLLTIPKLFASDCDGSAVDWLERACEVGPSGGKPCRFSNLLGNTLCRVRRSPALVRLGPQRRRLFRRLIWRPPWRLASCGRRPRRRGHLFGSRTLRLSAAVREKLLDTNITTLAVALSKREVGIPALVRPPRLHVSLFTSARDAVFDSELSGTAEFLSKLREGTCSTAHRRSCPVVAEHRALRVLDAVLLIASEALTEQATKELFVKDAESCLYTPTNCSTQVLNGNIDYKTNCILLHVNLICLPLAAMASVEFPNILLSIGDVSAVLRPVLGKRPGQRPMSWPSFSILQEINAGLRPLPWPSFNLVARCSVRCYSDRLWKPPWPTQIRQQISFALNDLAVPWKYMMLPVLGALVRCDSVDLRPRPCPPFNVLHELTVQWCFNLIVLSSAWENSGCQCKVLVSDHFISNASYCVFVREDLHTFLEQHYIAFRASTCHDQWVRVPLFYFELLVDYELLETMIASGDSLHPSATVPTEFCVLHSTSLYCIYYILVQPVWLLSLLFQLASTSLLLLNGSAGVARRVANSFLLHERKIVEVTHIDLTAWLDCNLTLVLDMILATTCLFKVGVNGYTIFCIELQPWPPPNILEIDINIGVMWVLHGNNHLALEEFQFNSKIKQMVGFAIIQKIIDGSGNLLALVDLVDEGYSQGDVLNSVPWQLPALAEFTDDVLDDVVDDDADDYYEHEAQDTGRQLYKKKLTQQVIAQFLWDPGGSKLLHRLGDKPKFKKGGMSGITRGWTIRWALGLYLGLVEHWSEGWGITYKSVEAPAGRTSTKISKE